GTGGFASRSKRFGVRSMPSMPPAGLGCPGPGAYQVEKVFKSMKDPQYFNRAETSGVFNGSKSISKVAPAAAMPGPGQYNPTLLPNARDAASCQSSFLTGANRGVGPGRAEDMPGPGEYWDGLNRPIGTIAEHLLGADLRNANFKEPSKKHISKVHKDLPAACDRARGVLGEFYSEVSKECLGTVGQAATMPGPGHYNQDRDAMWAGNCVPATGSSAFQVGPKRTDWAPEELGLYPGPGFYELKKGETGKLTTALSAFKSASERNSYQISAAPGPAYYNPKLRPHKSFRLKTVDFVS
ncbi:unnamed protein product, partial [Polarella glacialis]